MVGFLVCGRIFWQEIGYSPPSVDSIWGLYLDNGKENGNYYLGFRV